MAARLLTNVVGGFKDHFSETPHEYARFRTRYPKALFAQLAARVEAQGRAWDCGTGSGQAAASLSSYFREVLASDPSHRQLLHAGTHPRIRYFAAKGEAVPIRDHSVDLITVAQALHWFDRARFYAEVNRVLKPGGVIAVWCYELMRIAPEIDRCVERYCYETVGPFWPPERRWVEQGYRTLEFPFDEFTLPQISMEADWPLEAVLGYLGTWSATQRYRQTLGEDPLPALRREIAPLWGDTKRRRTIRWPLNLRLGRSVVSPQSGC